MKITKNRLKQIIQEELNLMEVRGSRGEPRGTPEVGRETGWQVGALSDPGIRGVETLAPEQPRRHQPSARIGPVRTRLVKIQRLLKLADNSEVWQPACDTEGRPSTPEEIQMRERAMELYMDASDRVHDLIKYMDEQGMDEI
jgi:hypothetical protein